MARPDEKLNREKIVELSDLLYKFQLMVEGDDIYNEPKQIGAVVKIIDNYLK